MGWAQYMLPSLNICYSSHLQYQRKLEKKKFLPGPDEQPARRSNTDHYLQRLTLFHRSQKFVVRFERVWFCITLQLVEFNTEVRQRDFLPSLTLRRAVTAWSSWWVARSRKQRVATLNMHSVHEWSDHCPKWSAKWFQIWWDLRIQHESNVLYMY